MDIDVDRLVEADFLPAPARVKKFEDRGPYHLFEAVVEESGRYLERHLTPDQVEEIDIIDENQNGGLENPEDFFLYIEANRIRMAHRFDPMLAVNTSTIDPIPHQIEAVYDYALQEPRLRFMIADDAGAGKTIMGGLILKEMMHRGMVERVLIVSPGHLKFQWQREMEEKFDTSFHLVDRDVIRAHPGENVWSEIDRAIASVDFIKQEDIKSALSASRWDLVIVDEAHKMAAYTQRTKDRKKVEKTLRYKVGEVLSEQTEHMLFLSATPHRGKQDNFRLLLDLLRPGFFATNEILREAVERGENPIFIRRLKEDMVDFEGAPLFPPRHVRTLKFRLTEDEKTLYNRVTQYVQNYYDQAKENRHITFALIIMQRRLTSSTHAILSSLQRRREKLEELLKLPEKIENNDLFAEVRGVSEEELDEMPEETRWEIEEKLEKLTIANNIGDVEAEINELDELIELAKKVRSQGDESKLLKLREEILSELGGRKLLIFTEHKDTLFYLERRLREWGYDVNTIHGGMSQEARVAAEEVFRTETQIMVATEAAGEGINLQHCSLMVNYDIPWNPNRLEQRMGRIHRYGQEDEVFIWNMIGKDTREGDLLSKLFVKLERMREDLGDDRVFDIIGDVLPGKNLQDLLKEAILNQRQIEEVEYEIDKVDKESVNDTLDKIYKDGLATRHLNLNELREEQREADEHRLVPEYVEDFFRRAFERFEGKIEKRKNGYRIDSVPYELRKVNDDETFVSQYGTVDKTYRKVTFRKELASKSDSFEFIAPGHPLLEAVNQSLLRNVFGTDKPVSTFWDPDRGREGLLWFVSGQVVDARDEEVGRRIFCLHHTPEDEFHRVNPSILWDLEPSREAGGIGDRYRDLLDRRREVDRFVFSEVLTDYKEELQQQRDRQADIKERYGLQSLEHLIDESNQKLLEWEMREQEGEDYDLVIDNEERRLEELHKRKKTLIENIRLERNLSIQSPKVVGKAVLLAPEDAVSTDEIDSSPDDKSSSEIVNDMHRDEEVEAMGMKVARDYEESEGRRVEDVSEKDHGGFDLRAHSYDEDGRLEGTRYIEVKARARSGRVRITANEWKQARKFGDEYWLYVVTEASKDSPNLTRINNPASRFEENEDIRATGYVINENTWKTKADTDE